jgi:hypothetical protein
MSLCTIIRSILAHLASFTVLDLEANVSNKPTRRANVHALFNKEIWVFATDLLQIKTVV